MDEDFGRVYRIADLYARKLISKEASLDEAKKGINWYFSRKLAYPFKISQADKRTIFKEVLIDTGVNLRTGKIHPLTRKIDRKRYVRVDAIPELGIKLGYGVDTKQKARMLAERIRDYDMAKIKSIRVVRADGDKYMVYAIPIQNWSFKRFREYIRLDNFQRRYVD